MTPERDYKAEIEAARDNPEKLRKITADIHQAGGSQILMIRAINLAKAAEAGPHPLGRMSEALGLPRPRGIPLYRYKIAPGAVARIEKKLASGLLDETQQFALAPAFVVWAADWFRRSYQGGVQRWADIENTLGLRLPQNVWRDITDKGFRAWKIEPLITSHGNQRLSNLARHGGFPAAAMASGDSWPRKFLERVVGELLGSGERDIASAVATCERNEYLLPPLWRSPEMYAICGELTFKIVELRTFADKELPADDRPYSVRLDQVYEDWRDELPMTLDGAAGALIDTLLQAKKLFSTGSIRVARLMSHHGEGWRECLDLHLAGRWEDKEHTLSPEDYSRIFLQPADDLADRVSGRLAYLEHEQAHHWIARPMRSEAAIEFPFEFPVTAEFHARGDRLTRSFVLPGGKPVGAGLRVFEQRGTDDQNPNFALIGQGSGAYRAEPVFIDAPPDWSLRGGDANAEIELKDFTFAPGRCLYRCSGSVIAQKSNGDRFLIRTGQSADRKDRLSIVADAVPGLQTPNGKPLYKHPLHARVADGVSHRVAARGEVSWRFVGDRGWVEDLDTAGPGLIEFAWLDRLTGHVRDRLTALVLPTEFELSQRNNGTFAEIELKGWDGSADLGAETPCSRHSWRVRINPPRRALLTLRLASPRPSAFDLIVPLQSKEWITTWSGDLLPRDAVIGLADLRDAVARVSAPSILMAEVRQHSGAALEASWRIDSDLGLSALRTDIAALMRPLGIDAQVRLDFHNGSNDHWYVTEFGNALEWEPNGGLRPKTAIVGQDAKVCGRALGAPEKELELGSYDGLLSGLGGQVFHLPRLKGDWLVYLREGSRVLTRPKFVQGDLTPEVPQHQLGRAMAQPIELARDDLRSLVREIAQDPTTPEAGQTIQAILKLAFSLNGLPPQTFEIFGNLEEAEALAPLMLYRCEEQHLSTILELFEGLCSSWVLLPHGAWGAAFQAQGHFLVSRLDDPQWAVSKITERQNEIAARAPQLAPLVCRDFRPLSWEEVRRHFTGHTAEGINTETAGFNPFRPAFRNLLPQENFHESLMRVFDAPFAAALAAMGRVSLGKIQILTIKDVERRHPTYFAMAYGYALTELTNDR